MNLHQDATAGEYGVLLMVDVQNDFCEGGSLACEGGRGIVPVINNILAQDWIDLVIATQDWHPMNHISFASSHLDGKRAGTEPLQGEIAPFKRALVVSHNTADYAPGTGKVDKMLWPDHCVAGTVGASFYYDKTGGSDSHLVELNTESIDLIYRKGANPELDSFSGFKDELGQPTPLWHYVNSLLKTNCDGLAIKFYVVGIATDVCVKATALDLLDGVKTHGHGKASVAVIANACVGVTKEGHEKALAEMASVGIKIETLELKEV